MGGRGGSANGSALGQALKQATPAAAPAVRSNDGAEDKIRLAYEKLAIKPGGWVRLTAIRDALGGEKSAADEALRNLANTGGAEFIPIANLKSLSPADREAAIKVGGELKHLIRIER